MTRIPIRVRDAAPPREPLHLKCSSRALGIRIGALPRGYFFGTCLGDPVMLVSPTDSNNGLIWPLHDGAYLGTDDRLLREASFGSQS